MKKIHVRFAAAALCTAAFVSGCSAASTSQDMAPSTVAVVSESSASGESASEAVLPSDPASAEPSETSETEAAQTLDPSESLSNELYAMDTVMSLTAYGPNAQKALAAAETEINRLDALFSISSETGDISRINQSGSGDLSEDSRILLSSALDYYKETDGIFDCTIEPVMEAWGFTTQNYRVPEQSELDDLLSRVDASCVSLTDSHVMLPEDVRLDLGGIAKGFTSARVMKVFAENGVTSGIISLGGNVQTLGRKPDGSLWRVGVQDPVDQNAMFAVVEVADEAVITSGAYQRYFEQDGIHYHHIIDPRTGYPANNGLISVTIISPDGTLADALSTSLFIMGPEKAAAFWQNHRDQFDAILMTDNGDVLVTSGLADRCQITGGGKVQVIS